MDVENLQLVPDDLRAGVNEEFAGLAESEDCCDVRSMYHVEQKLVGDIGEIRFGAWLLRLCAVALLAVLEDHVDDGRLRLGVYV